MHCFVFDKELYMFWTDQQESQHCINNSSYLSC